MPVDQRTHVNIIVDASNYGLVVTNCHSDCRIARKSADSICAYLAVMTTRLIYRQCVEKSRALFHAIRHYVCFILFSHGHIVCEEWAMHSILVRQGSVGDLWLRSVPRWSPDQRTQSLSRSSLSGLSGTPEAGRT